MTTKDLAELPETITVQDTYGQTYRLDARNALWPDALTRYLAGEVPVYSAAQLKDAREWGWWSCYERQEEWLASCGVPVPDHRLLYGLDSAAEPELRRLLMEFGGYVSWLEAQLGAMEGRRSALKQGYEAAVLTRSAGDEAKGTEKSKEARLLAGSETLRHTKRLLVEQETLLATARGLRDSYQSAWDTVSRVTTVRLAEKELATGRHA